MESSSDQPVESLAPITATEYGELYDALAENPLGAIALGGLTRDEYIQRQGRVERAVVEDESDREAVLAYASNNAGFQPVATFEPPQGIESH